VVFTVGRGSVGADVVLYMIYLRFEWALVAPRRAKVQTPALALRRLAVLDER
jgi:hypothetical protein